MTRKEIPNHTLRDVQMGIGSIRGLDDAIRRSEMRHQRG